MVTIKFSQLAALADCIEGVNMDRVNQYRQLLRIGEGVNPIKVCDLNPQGYYVIEDGHHRTLAHALEGHGQILAEVNQSANIANISWRWPRISPITHTLELIKMSCLEDAGYQQKIHPQ